MMWSSPLADCILPKILSGACMHIVVHKIFRVIIAFCCSTRSHNIILTKQKLAFKASSVLCLLLHRQTLSAGKFCDPKVIVLSPPSHVVLT